ncbi:hypothetical protein [uncultured Empedobacter sp.]|uniref:hypothetical protein n=1 Tax=uncultured Empedobacter sp. TaxID=410844 RepID=UPI0025DD5877|nr:hypothetical protein [uncultured Empedobacter sp.]
MNAPTVINLFKSLQEAMFFRNSQINTQFIFSGIQLLPNNPNKYIQVTNTPNGINLEDWTVKVVSLCGEELGDITDSFMVESLTNSDNGNPQFIWSLQNITQDFGWDLIYLQITQAVGETFYSQPFRITAINSEKVSQINYKFRETDEIQSIGFNIWFDDIDLLQELTTYYEESTQSYVSASMEQAEIEYWRTELMPKYLLVQLKKILGLPYVYINDIRASLKEATEIPKKTSQENFAEMSFVLNFHPNDIFVQPEASNGDFLDTDFDSNDFLIYN